MQHLQKTGGGSDRPHDIELFWYEGEVFVAGGEGGFTLEGKSGGKTVRVLEFVFGAEFSGATGQFQIGVDDLQGELGDVLDDFSGEAGAFGAPGGVVHFAPIHHGHQ